MEYLKFHELAEEPFRSEHDERFEVELSAVGLADLRVLRTVYQHKPLGVVVAPPGCGKTRLARRIASELEGEEVEVSGLSIPPVGATGVWLLAEVCNTLGLDRSSSDSVRALEVIADKLDGLNDESRSLALLIDDADRLAAEPGLVAAFRGLLCAAESCQPALSIVLFGGSGLQTWLAEDDATAQRVDVRVALTKMTREETEAYVARRLEVAGGKGQIFESEAIDALYRFSEGVPRRVNTLADNALFESYLCEARKVDASFVLAAASALGLADAEPGPASTRQGDTRTLLGRKARAQDDPSAGSGDNETLDAAAAELLDVVVDSLDPKSQPDREEPDPVEEDPEDEEPASMPDLDAMFDDIKIDS